MHSFTDQPDGSQPDAALLFAGGKLYGTTYYGGTYGHGTVFSVDAMGKESVVYSFLEAVREDGLGPVSLPITQAISTVLLRLVSQGTVLYSRSTGSATKLCFTLSRAGTTVVTHRQL